LQPAHRAVNEQYAVVSVQLRQDAEVERHQIVVEPLRATEQRDVRLAQIDIASAQRDPVHILLTQHRARLRPAGSAGVLRKVR
jgi:hypothetical protein